MWQWIMDALNRASKALEWSSNEDREDAVSETMFSLCGDEKLAKKIYESKEVRLLYVILRTKRFEQKCGDNFENKMEFSRYLKIIAACNEHNIEPIPDNAYKIAAILEDDSHNFSISSVREILLQTRMTRVDFSEDGLTDD